MLTADSRQQTADSRQQTADSNNFLKFQVLSRGLENNSKSEFEKAVFHKTVFHRNNLNLSKEELSSSIYKIETALKAKPAKISSILKDVYYSGIESAKIPSTINIFCAQISKSTKYDSLFNKKIIKIKFGVIDSKFTPDEKQIRSYVGENVIKLAFKTQQNLLFRTPLAKTNLHEIDSKCC